MYPKVSVTTVILTGFGCGLAVDEVVPYSLHLKPWSKMCTLGFHGVPCGLNTSESSMLRNFLQWIAIYHAPVLAKFGPRP